MMILSRRTILTGLASCAGSAALGQDQGHGYREWQPRTYDDGLIPNFSFEVIELSLLGGLAVFAIDSEIDRFSGWAETYRQPLNSTVKFLIVAALLHRVDTGQENLERDVRIEHPMLVSHSPALEPAVGRTLSVFELCTAAMTVSDNGAANVLLESIGGPQSLTTWLRETGDQITQVDRYLPELTTASETAEGDTSTALQMAQNLRMFLTGTVLSSESRALLRQWMTENTTGLHRIRAGVPAGWAVADRTGTGSRNHTSTIAAIYPPNRKPLFLSIYMSSERRDAEAQSGHHAEIARIATTNLLLPPYDPYPDE